MSEEKKVNMLEDDDLDEVSGGCVSCGHPTANIRPETCPKCNTLTMEPQWNGFEFNKGSSYGVPFKCSTCGHSYTRYISGMDLYNQAIQDMLNGITSHN